MAGNVYVFNVSSQDLLLGINGGQTGGGAIAAWPPGGPDQYRPNVQAVPRTLNASQGRGTFFNGANALSLEWLDGLFLAQVTIDGGALPLNQDVLLFVARNSWQLVNQFAVQIASGPVQPPWGHGEPGGEAGSES